MNVFCHERIIPSIDQTERLILIFGILGHISRYRKGRVTLCQGG
jgi:hypothetical protein